MDGEGDCAYADIEVLINNRRHNRTPSGLNLRFRDGIIVSGGELDTSVAD